MNIDELICTLLAIRRERGNLPVIVYDGNDPCDLEAISRVETGTQQFFSRRPPGGLCGELVTQEAVTLLP